MREISYAYGTNHFERESNLAAILLGRNDLRAHASNRSMRRSSGMISGQRVNQGSDFSTGAESA